ncbi:MAG: YceI family protein [Bacteroidales bacterium]|jgi:polyisoprenoid-binding protein YceI|nr:YceI family protein [Bacteroidales bacterium]
MKIKTLRQILTAVLLVALYPLASAQNPVLIEKESKVKISGTSNLHDWQEAAEEFSIEMKLSTDGASSPMIDMVNFKCKAASIISDNSIMTNKTHNALNVEKHPEIHFSSADKSALRVIDGKFSSTISGVLTINGIAKQVEVPVDGHLADGKLHVKGEKPLRMSDFEIKAPTALLGTLKTGNDVTVSFELSFELSPNNAISALNK